MTVPGLKVVTSLGSVPRAVNSVVCTFLLWTQCDVQVLHTIHLREIEEGLEIMAKDGLM